ncbi:MAG: TPR domain-containing protein [Treponema sp.]
MNIIKNYLYSFVLFIKNLFKDKKIKIQKEIDYDATPEEEWICNSFIPPFSNARFREEKGDGYHVFFETAQSSLALELERKNLYAWVQNKVFRYKDFVLEAIISIEKDSIDAQCKNTNLDNEMAGSCATGFLFRNTEKAFYSVLISNAGFLRVDVVINNTPKTLIPWTKLIEKIDNKFKLTIISFDSSITCLVNDIWIGCIEDDIINASGKIAFAGQNYSQSSHVKFLLKTIKINSHPIHVQNKYLEANNEKNIKKEARRNLANSYYIIGNLPSSIAEIKKIENTELETEDALLAGKVYFSARLIERSEEYFLKAIELFPKNKEATIQLLNLYYYSNQYEKLKQTLDTLSKNEIETSSSLCNLKAHYLHYLGKHNEAAFFYNMAFILSKKEGKEQGLFALNSGKEHETAGNINAAISSYIEASNIFLKTQQYIDMGQTLNALEHLAKNGECYLSLSAKFYYAIKKYDEATKYLEILTKQNSKNADVWYLYALILEMNKDKKAIKAFKKAHTLNPNESLYCFRYAKALYSEKKECITYLEKAIELDEKNGWAYNLYAVLMTERNKLDEALQYIKKAREHLPSEISVLANFIHIKRMRGELNDCYVLFAYLPSIKNEKNNQEIDNMHEYSVDLSVEQNRAEAYHLFANELHQIDSLEQAHTWYEKAIKLKPNDDKLLLDAAINSHMLGYINEAENYAVKALDILPSLEAYRLIATIAKEMGNYARSETSLMQALNDYGKNEDVLFDLANLFLSINKKEKVSYVLEEIKSLPNSKEIMQTNRFIELKHLIEE